MNYTKNINNGIIINGNVGKQEVHYHYGEEPRKQPREEEYTEAEIVTDEEQTMPQAQDETGPTEDPEPQDDGEPAPRHLPDVLATPEAMKLWEVAQREGWVDERYQPTPGLPRWKKAIIANVMGEMAGVRNKWQVLEEFWQMRYLRQEYQEAKKNDGFYSFLHELERLGGEKMKQTLAYVKRKR